jgi:hypothetical protein
LFEYAWCNVADVNTPSIRLEHVVGKHCGKNWAPGGQNPSMGMKDTSRDEQLNIGGHAIQSGTPKLSWAKTVLQFVSIFLIIRLFDRHTESELVTFVSICNGEIACEDQIFIKIHVVFLL